MANREVHLGESRHESVNIDYGIDDKVVLNELGAEKIGINGLTGKVVKIEKQLNGRATTTIQTTEGEEVTKQSNFFRKARKVKLGSRPE